jgi:hypothetical protein
MAITAKLHHVIAEELQKPFQYGVNDCALFVNTVYKRVYGMDLAGDVVGTYNDEYHAAKVLVKLGGFDGIMESKGFEKINKNFVKVGDIVISQKAAGIFVGNGKAVFAGGAYHTFDMIETVYTFKGKLCHKH